MKLRRRWRFAFLALLVTIATVAAHRVAPAQPSALVESFLHSLHGPGFAVVAAVLFWLVGPFEWPILRYGTAAIAAGAIALIAELAQIPGARDAQLSDLVIDAVGVAGGLLAIATFDLQLHKLARPARRAKLAAVAGLALVVACAPGGWYLYALASQLNAEPQLLSFEKFWEASTYWPTDRKHLRLQAAPKGWPDSMSTVALARESGSWGALIRIYPVPDWSTYSAVSFTAASATDKTHRLTVALRDMRGETDRYSTRVSTSVLVGPKPGRIRIALSDFHFVEGDGPIDLRHVGSFVISAFEPGGDVAVLFDDFQLER